MSKKKTPKKRRKAKTTVSDALAARLYSHHTKVRFTVSKRTFEIDLSDDLLIKYDIHTEVERIAATLGYFGSIISSIEFEVETKKAIKKQIEARLDGDLRNSGVTGEMRIDKAIKRHPKWFEAVMEVNRTEANLSRAKSLYNALIKKSTAVFSRSNDIRVQPNDSIMDFKKSSIGKVREKS